MRHFINLLAILFLALLLPIISGRPPVAHTQSAPETAHQMPASPPLSTASFGEQPLYFEENVGQTAAPVDYLSRGEGYTLYLSPDEATFMLRQPTGYSSERGTLAPDDVEVPDMRHVPLKMGLVGGNPNARPLMDAPLPGVSNYFLGNDPEQWRTNVKHYAAVRYEGVYPGVDVVYHGSTGVLQYDFHLAPGASVEDIRLRFDGAASVGIDENGDLLLVVDGETVRQRAPVSYQDIDGEQIPVESRFVLLGEGEVGFDVGAYDAGRELVIDPAVVYSLTFGGSAYDAFYGMTVDGMGAAYLTGGTESTDFPLLNPLQSTSSLGTDAFVMKLAPDGTLVYSTYLGDLPDGEGNTVGYGIAIDGSGAVYVAGQTDAAGFPLVNPFQSEPAALKDGFVAKLAPDGGSLLYSTFLGGDGHDSVFGIDLAADGAVVVTGSTGSTDFPTVNPLYAYQPENHVFLARISPAGDSLVFSTYLLGSIGGGGLGNDVKLDSSGNVYVVLQSQGSACMSYPNLSIINEVGSTLDDLNVIVLKLSSGGESIVKSSCIGGSGRDSAGGIAINDGGAVFIAGDTNSDDFPLVDPVLTGEPRATDAFLAKLSPAGDGLVWSTRFFGSYGSFVATGPAVNSAGEASLSFGTITPDLPLVDPLSEEFGSHYMAKLSASGDSILFGSYFGMGTPLAHAVGPNGNLFAAGELYLGNDEYDGFVAQVSQDPYARFRGDPSPPGPLVMKGPAGTAPIASIDIDNGGYPGMTLDVSLSSLTSGYTITGGLPITNLATTDSPVTVTVQCDEVGVTPSTGTLELTTNDPSQPTVTYDLSCEVPPPVFSGSPSPPGPLLMEGLKGDTLSTSFEVSNAGDVGSLLNASISSLTAGYTVTGLPIDDLAPGDAAVTVDVQCDAAGEATPASGTLELLTNIPGEEIVTYDLRCETPRPRFSTYPPLLLEMVDVLGTSPIATLRITNGGEPNSRLDVTFVSISSGFTLLDDAPIENLEPDDDPVFVRVQCDSVGEDSLSGELQLATNDPGQPAPRRNLRCRLPEPDVYKWPPTINVWGFPGTSATTTMTIANQGEPDSLLDLSLSDTDEGVSVIDGLPITGLTPDDDPVTVTVQCDAIGDTQTSGLVFLATNDPDLPVYSLTIYCNPWLPDFWSSPDPSVAVEFNGTGGVPVQRNISVANAGDDGTVLEVNLLSITDGYSVIEGLPITGLTPVLGTREVTIQCDNPGVSAPTGVLELATNLAEQPTISYDLVCTAGDSSVDTPIILEVETTCTGITLHYLAQGGPNANLGYAYTVYQSIPGGTGIPVTTGTLAALEVDERYTVEIPFTRRYPPGTAFYLEVLASSDSIITPVQACTP